MGDSRERTKQLGAWFLGPKAENASLEEEMILYILRDYFHWRRNYFPSDEITITQQMRRESLAWNDALLQQLSEMLAGLKRDFPFYSPRYVAHMLSDQTIPSVLGYFAGMLYNPNNVTPEAAPVTVEWELEVAADILRMLGYAPPPRGVSSSRELRREFGWAHITGGGTVANLEALWVARNVRYAVLAIRKACRDAGIPLTVKLPSSTETVLLAGLSPAQCLFIKPNEAIFLLPRFFDAVGQHFHLDEAAAARHAWRLLAETDCYVARHGVSCFAQWPPALLVSGTAHYSITKAADVLGIGRENVILVDVDKLFRMDVRDLEQKVRQAVSRGLFPLAVIAIGGTTEEGAVDPVHQVVEYRQRLEARQDQSFWLHVDAAWAGYLRSLFLGGAAEDDAEKRIEAVAEFVSRSLSIRRGHYQRTVRVRWGSPEVCHAYLAFPRAESITVDPHKMGYVPYPCGVVAFRNDRVRQFLTQEAPYISNASATGSAPRTYQPPVSLGPFILEGSKPGAAAASCWLSHRMIPPNREGYGEIMRASLLAAREFYERLVHWEQSCRANKIETRYRFIPVTAPPPDTNMVCFLINAKDNRCLRRMNRLGEAVYQRFSITAEPRAREFSYSQPFFLSRTRFQVPQYSAQAVASLLERAGVDGGSYEQEGIFVLRSTLMNPYLVLNAESGHQQALLGELVETLASYAEESVAAGA